MSRMNLLKLLSLLATLMFPTAIAAQDAAPAPPPSAIATKTAASENADIANRIRSIFSEIEPLRAVQVRVSAGVVTLSGTVAATDDARRAQAIAERVSGVVTVQNDIKRDLQVNSNLSPTLGQAGDGLRGLVSALPLIGVAIGIGAALALLGYLLASVDRFWRWITPNLFLAELVAGFVRFAFVILGIIATLQVLGATALLGGVLGGAGIIGIALGFAVRDTVDNYVSSLMLSLRQPFRANDHVVIEGHEGRVIRLTSRATVLMTLDGNHLRIPNAIVFKSVILNYTRNSERRFSFDLGVDANDDPIAGMAVGLAAVNALSFVLDAPKATAIIQEVGDSNILLRFFGWIDQQATDFLKGRSLAIQAAKSALEAAGFALPEPIYRLRFDEGAAPVMQSLGAPTARLRANVPPPATAAPPEGDTAPDHHVAKLVEDERQATRQEDLLDSGQPIE